MIYKCYLCKREFDKKKPLKDHERTAHPEGVQQFILNEAARKVAIESCKGEKS